jgi:hypothetical protein
VSGSINANNIREVKVMKKYLKHSLLALMMIISMLTGCAAPVAGEADVETDILVEEYSEEAEAGVVEDGEYSSKEEVAEYLYLYGHLPSNYITKNEAKELGWVNKEGNLWDVAPGMSIGGDYFGNYEGILPEEDGRDYHECDIDFDGTYRNAKRIVYSNDGLIYYTEDHYETFELLYGEE